MTKRLELATVTSPPGATIRDLLEERGIAAEDFAPRIGLDPHRMRDLLDGSLLLGKKLSRRLAYQLGSTPEFWLQRESNYRASINAVISNSVREPDSTRGGKRPGAGRPTTTGARAARKTGKPRGRAPQIDAGINCTVRLPAEFVAALDAWAASCEIPATRSDAIRHCVAAFIAK